ncbi:MAG: capsule assembly Wzi family protein [Bacteroidales bacterium]
MRVSNPVQRPFYSVILLMLLLPLSGEAQVKKPYYEASMNSVVAAGEQTPFWLMSDRQGKYGPEKYTGSMDMGIFAERDTGKVFDYEYGLELYGRLSRNEDAWLHQAYAGATLFDLFYVKAGMWEQIVGSKEPTISSGSIIWSGNARPMPKVEAGIPDYVPVPFTRDYLEIKGVMAHGWFEKDRYVKDVWLHHKNAYLRLGGDLPVNLYFGFNHYAMWGGKSPAYETPFPSDFETFWDVFFNRQGDPDKEGIPESWVINRVGNSVGSRNHGIDVELEKVNTGIYLQDVFEDGSGRRRNNFPDGLWGVWLRFKEEKKPVQAVAYEFLHTTDQSGRYHEFEGDTVGGNDNYFNHGKYQSGWTHHEYTIGTPLITSPLLNDAATHKIMNNKVVAHHLGITGYINRNIKYRNLLTYSRNFGTNKNPYTPRKEQFHWLLEVNKNLGFHGLEAGVAIALDIGEMYGDNFGVMISLVKRGDF